MSIKNTIEGAGLVGSVASQYQDKFGLDTITDAWDINIQNGDILSYGGNSVGSKYLRHTTGIGHLGINEIISKKSFSPPFRFTYGLSTSQRLVGQLLAIDLVGVDKNKDIETIAEVADINISGDITIATNVATINTATEHGFFGGDRIHIVGCTDTRLNVGLVAVTVISKTKITVPLTLANATYTVGTGRLVNHGELNYALNGVGMAQETTTPTTNTLITRRNGNSPRTATATILTSVATNTNTSAFTDSFAAANEVEIVLENEQLVVYPRTTDGLVAGIPIRVNNSIPDAEKRYKVRIRSVGMPNFVYPSLKILTASKTGTTTATITTATEHGLTTSSFIQIYGCRNITNFPNLVAATQVASIIDTTSFTIVMAGAVTANTVGGVIAINHGSALLINVQNVSIQSISRTSNSILVTTNATMATPLPGEYFSLWGMDGSAAQYDGSYKVLKFTAAALTMELESIGPDFGTINCGGAVLKNTDMRLHYIRVTDYARSIVDLANARGGQTDNARSLPVAVSGGILPTVTTVTAVTSANLGIPGIIADIASAALTTTTTTAAITPTFGSTYTVMIAATAVTGTNPVLDLQIQESDDTGTNWFVVYDFPRITASGAYRSPPLRLSGNRVRYVQTVAGTTPSFTRSLNRLQSSISENSSYRQIIDRSINVNSLNSVTPSLTLAHGDSCQLVVNVGAITTTAAQFQLEGSDDFATATPTWYAIGTPLTCVASSTVASAVVTMSPLAIRARVSTAGSGVTAGYVLIKSV